MRELLVIVSQNCPACHRLTEELNRRNLVYELINVDMEQQKLFHLGVPIHGVPASIIKENGAVFSYYVGYSQKIVNEIARELK